MLITQIAKSNFDQILNILTKYGKEIIKEDDPDLIINRYKGFLDTNDYKLYFYQDDDLNQGMSLLNIQEQMMYNFYFVKSNESSKSEIEFFNWIFHYLKNTSGGFISQFPFLSDSILEQMNKLGIETLIRHIMLIDKANIIGLSEPTLEDQYKFSPWDDKYIDKSAELTVDAYEGTLDSRIFVFFQKIEGAKKFNKNVSNGKFGKFDKNIESVLLERGEIIGVCFFNMDENKGFIPSVTISSKKKGLGLGKSLMIHMMKDLIQTHDIESVGLVVTEKNQNAYQLYKKLGFKTINSGFTYLM
ncbi:MAG: GNAT family N-acetyltransferase [Candidatus Heimdallarchaeota archaeon]|nr:GNAT family N-acetyltransferase [Candidatus Heimdallarchaeota archaeon]